MTSNRAARRMEVVKEHVRRENAHELDAVMQTFGKTSWYDDEPWGEHHEGRAAVRSYYAELMRALPDLHIDIERQYVTEEKVILEVIITGTHLGRWRGMPPTGQSIEFPLCAIFSFDEDDNIAGERIYYDRLDVLKQLGVQFDPASLMGRLTAVLLHPLTLGRMVKTRLSAPWSGE